MVKLNKKGFALFYALMIGILCLFLGLALAPSLSDVVEEAMYGTELNCSSTDLTQTNQAICTQLDFFTFVFMGLLFGLGGVILGGLA